MTTQLLAKVVGVLALALIARPGVAAPITQSMQATADAATYLYSIERVHRCNRICRRGPVEEWGGLMRWHRHVGPQCRVVRCRPE